MNFVETNIFADRSPSALGLYDSTSSKAGSAFQRNPRLSCTPHATRLGWARAPIHLVLLFTGVLASAIVTFVIVASLHALVHPGLRAQSVAAPVRSPDRVNDRTVLPAKDTAASSASALPPRRHASGQRTGYLPWQLFQQSCVADKRLRFADLNNARIDTFIGATFTVVVAACMIVVGDQARRHGIKYEDPAQLASAMLPFIGPMARKALPLLMVNAAVLGTIAISLASVWAYGELKGWSHCLEKGVHEARGFYAVYGISVALAAAIVLIPGAPLQLIILGVQVLAGVILPSAIIFLQLLLNDHELLGDGYVST